MSRSLQEEKRSEMLDEDDKPVRACHASVLLSGNEESSGGLNDRSGRTKTSQKYKCSNCGHDGD